VNVAKAKRATWINRRPVRLVGGVWEYETTEHEVLVLAILRSWAWIRRPGCVPFAVALKDLRGL